MKPAALDITVTSLLTPAFLEESSQMAGAAALAAEARKKLCHGPELGWTCILVAVETYGSWGKEARKCFQGFHSTWPSTCLPPSLQFWRISMAGLSQVHWQSHPGMGSSSFMTSCVRVLSLPVSWCQIICNCD